MIFMQERLTRAAKELGVRVLLRYVVNLSDGRKLIAQALFPEFGTAFGTLVFRYEDAVDAAARRDLVAQGYGMSTFSESLPNEEFDLDSYREMLMEWGWTSEEAHKP